MAARVHSQITHSQRFAGGGLGGVLAGVGTLALLYFFPPADIYVGISALASGIGVGKAVGEFGGSKFDDPSAGDVVTGSPSIVLDVGVYPAARMSDKLKCHTEKHIATGSKWVFMDEDGWNASRRLDYTECAGQINNGVSTVLIGGPPVRRPSVVIEESAGFGYKLTFGLIDVAGLAAGIPSVLSAASKVGLEGAEAFANNAKFAAVATKAVSVATGSEAFGVVSSVAKGTQLAGDAAVGLEAGKGAKAGVDAASLANPVLKAGTSTPTGPAGVPPAEPPTKP